MIRRIAHAASIVGFVLAFVLVPTALAGKGGNGNGNGYGNSTSTGATLLSDCNPCALGTTAHFTGSGFDGSQASAMLSFTTADATISAMVPVNPDGTVSFSWAMSYAGTRDFCIYQRANSGKWELKADAIITVQ